MKVTLLDTETGETRESSGISTFSWAENNWSCDCNRETFFGVETEGNYCLGGKRFLVIRAEVEGEHDYECSLEELNADYPRELLERHKLTSNYGNQHTGAGSLSTPKRGIDGNFPPIDQPA